MAVAVIALCFYVLVLVYGVFEHFYGNNND
jgi:hypothetical protein